MSDPKVIVVSRPGARGRTGPAGAPGFAPIVIAAGTTFTVHSNQQVLFKKPPRIDGTLKIEPGGYLVGI